MYIDLFMLSLNIILKKMRTMQRELHAYAFNKSVQRGECRGKLKHISDARMRENSNLFNALVVDRRHI